MLRNKIEKINEAQYDVCYISLVIVRVTVCGHALKNASLLSESTSLSDTGHMTAVDMAFADFPNTFLAVSCSVAIT